MLNKLSNKKKLNNENIFIFGIKPKFPSEEYGYFLTKKNKKNINEVIRFIEKPPEKINITVKISNLPNNIKNEANNLAGVPIFCQF